MLKHALNVLFYGILLGSLLVFDYLLGNGFVGMIQRNFCKIYCFIKKTIRDQGKAPQVPELNEINVLILITEVIALCCTMLLLNLFKKNNMDRLLPEAVEGKNDKIELLDKLILRRVNRSNDSARSFTFGNPELIKPLHVEVPVLQMAIIDTLGTTRSRPERGDAGDIYNITDSAILSTASLFDKDFKLSESMSDDIIDVEGGIPFS